jgi:hypothetical protein
LGVFVYLLTYARCRYEVLAVNSTSLMAEEVEDYVSDAC